MSGVAVTLNEGGTVTVRADGTFDYDPTTSTSLNALAVSESLTETFTYRANDIPTCGPPCATMISNNMATVVITVTGVNDDPVAVDDGDPGSLISTDEDTILTVATRGVLANDTDVDNGETATLTVDTMAGATQTTSAKGATIMWNANGQLRLQPHQRADVAGLGEGRQHDRHVYLCR